MFRQSVYIIFILLGFFLIYRGNLNQEDFKIVKGKIILSEVQHIGKYRSGTIKFVLVLEIEGNNEKIGFGLGDDTQFENNILVKEFQVGNDYTFYIDPSVIKTEGINLGIRKVLKGDEIIYEENLRGHIYFGLFWIFISLLFWGIYLKGQKRKIV